MTHPPRRNPRIASLLPGATEIALALGLRESLVAVSHSCDFPEVAALPRVTRTRIPLHASSGEIDRLVRAALARGGSLYQLDAEQLDAVEPDLILTQGICQVCAVGPGEVADAMPALRSSPEILSLEPRTLDETFTEILRVGQAVGRSPVAEELITSLKARVEAVRIRSERKDRRPRVAFLEWIDPLISGGHWNPELVALAGGDDGLGRPGVASYPTSWETVRAHGPELVVVAPCGFDHERAAAEASLPALGCRAVAVDANAYYARPAPRLADGVAQLGFLIHPELADDPGLPYVELD